MGPLPAMCMKLKDVEHDRYEQCTASCHHQKCEGNAMHCHLEGESLLNDATSITLFLVFLKEVQDLQSQTNPPKVGAHEFGVIVGNIIWLSVGECCTFACAQLPNKTLCAL